MMNKETKISLLQRARSLAAAGEDWPTYIASSSKLASAYVLQVDADGITNNERAWEVIVQAYEKAKKVAHKALTLEVCHTLVQVGLIQIEHLDSKQELEKLMIDCTKFVLKNTKDIYSKWIILSNIMAYENTKSQNKKRYLYWYNKLEILEKSFDFLSLDAESLLRLASVTITAYEFRRRKKQLDKAKLILQTIESKYPSVINNPNPRSWLFYMSRSRIAEFEHDVTLYIQSQLSALTHIKQFNPIDAANIVYNLAVTYYNINRHTDVEECLNALDEYVEIMWKVAWRRIQQAGTNAVRSDIYFYSWYFKLSYSFASYFYLMKNDLSRSLAWQERGLIRFYLTTIAKTYDGRFQNIGLIEEKLNSIICKNEDTIFVHFLFRGPDKYCIASNAKVPTQVLKFSSDIYDVLINLKGTEYETEEGFWEYYYVWQRTKGTGAFKRWENVLTILGELLGTYIFDPLLDKFTSSDIKKIVVVTNDWMDGIPLQLSKLGERYLVDRYDLIQVPSLLMSTILPRPGTDGMVVMEGHHPELQWAAKEVTDLKELAQQHRHPIQIFNEDSNAFLNMTTNFREFKASVLHIASHMYYVRDSSSQTSIILNVDGTQQQLRIDDILSGPTLSVPSGVTVVLSGCESNTMNFEKNGDHVSLARSFLLSGAGGIIGSAWAVDDIASYFLMNSMYTFWFQHPALGFGSALAKAQRWLRQQNVLTLLSHVKDETFQQILRSRYPAENEKPFQAPYYWAAWSYTGLI